MRIKIIKYAVIIIVGILLLNLMAANSLETKKAVGMIDFEKVTALHLQAVLYYFLFGILLQSHIIVKFFTKEAKLSFGLLLIPGILLLIVSLMYPFWLNYFSIYLPFPQGRIRLLNLLVGPLPQTPTIHIISLVSGTIIIKGLYKPKADERAEPKTQRRDAM